MRKRLLCVLLLFPVLWAQAQERDPTRPPILEGEVVSRPSLWAEQLMLTQVFYSEQTQKARINETWVKPGGSVEGANVVSIKPNSVVVEKNNETVEITLFKPIKQNKKGSPGAVQ
ncbi:Type II secretory pathway component [Idiomarina sp. HP20-50]|uniref:Type II secretory pathway component n=1 Tax=Idiomarina sp. HP20-50 TaxID=3070813 RepID=UPI00294B4FAA|nr:Type II secretory pathway component [Idiomarina sp. HP20-50]MDV6315938.1 Type II secretory pathway component [Idiomarina sp. HP20-50]